MIGLANLTALSGRLLVHFCVYSWRVQLPLQYRTICIVCYLVSADRSDDVRDWSTWAGRILLGGVEMERRNRCGEGAEKAIRSQRPRVGAPCTGDINQEESRPVALTLE